MNSFASLLKNDPRLSWIYEGKVRPYFSVAKEGAADLDSRFRSDVKDLFLDPLLPDQKSIEGMRFLKRALAVDKLTFHHNDMVMDDWVFYDCAVLPGVVCGFAAHHSVFPKELVDFPGASSVEGLEWIPISLFIMIPAVKKGQWVAHNLCSLNFTKKVSFYGLGFLSKLFGMLYAGVDSCLGITQWDSAALKVHSFYGPFQIQASYNLLHSLENTLTYSLSLDSEFWPLFFNPEKREEFFGNRLKPSGRVIQLDDNESLKELHLELPNLKQPLCLNPLDASQGLKNSKSLELYHY